MAPSPPKPWERTSTGSVARTSAAAPASAINATTSATPSTVAPPVPSRSYEMSSSLLNTPTYSPPYTPAYAGISGYGGLSSPYSRFGGMGSYGGYGGGMYGSSMYGGMGYGGYPGYGGYGGYGLGDPNDPNSLARRMEAATFQIIESIVGAFSGFAQMLESTFMATHSSFFAMVSVGNSIGFSVPDRLAEQFGNLRDTLGSIFGIYTLMKYLRIAIAKLRGKPLPSEETEQLSTDSFNTFHDTNAPNVPTSSRKPLIIFLLALFGLPYLMSKLIRGLAYAQSHALQQRHPPFDPSTAEFFRATFDFLPQNAAAEVPLKKGDVVAVVAKAAGGWWRVRLRDGRQGYVPASYLENVHNPSWEPLPIMSPPGEKGHAFIEEFKDDN